MLFDSREPVASNPLNKPEPKGAVGGYQFVNQHAPAVLRIYHRRAGGIGAGPSMFEISS
jgi:hypothetical protein